MSEELSVALETSRSLDIPLAIRKEEIFFQLFKTLFHLLCELSTYFATSISYLIRALPFCNLRLKQLWFVG